MRFLYLTIKFFPYWAIPLMLIFAEMAYLSRRRGNKKRMKNMAGLAATLFIFIVLFFALRWDMTLYPWIREQLQST